MRSGGVGVQVKVGKIDFILSKMGKVFKEGNDMTHLKVHPSLRLTED